MTEYSNRFFLEIVGLGFSYLQGLFDLFHEPKFRKYTYKKVQNVLKVHLPSFTGPILACCE